MTESRSTSAGVADHGTAMTSLIVGQGNGGVRGVAPDAKVRFYSIDQEPDTERIDCDPHEIGDVILRAARDGADVINMSVVYGLGSQEAVKKALSMGVVIVAGTGDTRVNGQAIIHPAGIPGVVGVGAVAIKDKKAVAWRYNPKGAPGINDDYTNGYTVLTAPGVDIPAGGWVNGAWDSNATRAGTSDATAIASGVAALVRSKYPDATGNQVIQSLIHHTGADNPYAWNQTYGFGPISASSALKYDPTAWPDTNPLLDGPNAALTAFPIDAQGQPVTTTVPKTLPTPKATASPDAKNDSAATSSNGSGFPTVIVLLVAVAAALTAAAAWWVNRRRTAPTHPSSSPDNSSQEVHR